MPIENCKAYDISRISYARQSHDHFLVDRRLECVYIFVKSWPQQVQTRNLVKVSIPLYHSHLRLFLKRSQQFPIRKLLQVFFHSFHSERTSLALLYLNQHQT